MVSLLERLINIDPSKRPSAAETLRILNSIGLGQSDFGQATDVTQDTGALVPATKWRPHPKAVVKALLAPRLPALSSGEGESDIDQLPGPLGANWEAKLAASRTLAFFVVRILLTSIAASAGNTYPGLSSRSYSHVSIAHILLLACISFGETVCG